MANFEEQIKRMKDLMGTNPLNEKKESSTNIEYSTEGADGKIYGIIKENTKYYIKTSTKDNEKIAESYDYIGGFCNRKNYEYNSYTNALKQLELKLMSLNEAYDKHCKTELLDPFKKEELVIEGTEKMKAEIARQRQIMSNAELIITEGDIGFKNTGVPEAPKTSSFTPSIGEPFSDKASATLDKDLKATASDPEKQGTPFDEEENVTDEDMQSDKNPRCNKKCDCKDAEYVPDNSVANQKPKGAKSVKMNESCEDWGSCGLPSTPGVGEDIPNVMGESEDIIGLDDDMVETDDIVGQDDELMPTEDDTMSDEDETFDDVISDEEFEDLISTTLNGQEENNNFDDELIDDYAFESVKKRKIDMIVESITKRILEGKRNTGTGVLNEKWFSTDKDFTLFYPKYSKLLDVLHDIKVAKTEEEVKLLDEKGMKIFLTLKRVINGLQNGKELDLKPGEREKLMQNLDSGTPEDIKTLLNSIDDIWEQIGNIWDMKYAKEADEGFKEKNLEWNKHKVTDLGYEATTDPNDIDALERKDKKYANESINKKNKVQEEATVLHDFGKHPGYRKKPMTLPSNDSKEKEGYKDWNDDSVKQDAPFGRKIGSSAPFDEKVKIITDAVMKQLKEMAKKKS